MEAYPYTLENGYPILQVGNCRFLVNTGSAQSMGSIDSIRVDGEIFPLQPVTMRMNAAQLAGQLGTQVDGMLGADILTQFDYKLLPETGSMVFTHGEFRPYGYANHFELYMGVPITPVNVFNLDMRFFFVTGSRRTFLNPDLVKGLQACGEAVDTYPGLGSFRTALFHVPVWVAGYDVPLEVGITPPPLIPMLKQTRSHGILGVDVLQGFELCLAPRRREGIWWRLGFGDEEPEGERRDPNDVPGFYY